MQPTQPPPQRVYVIFIAEIVPQTTEVLIQALSNLAQSKVQEVYIAFSTPGGSVMHGMTLYNFLRGVPFKLIMHNLGNVDSIGNAIFLAAEERYCCAHSTFMFHGVGFDRPASRYEEKGLREMLDGLTSDQRRIGAIISGHTSIPQDEIEGLFREAKTMTSEFARERGIVTTSESSSCPLAHP